MCGKRMKRQLEEYEAQKKALEFANNMNAYILCFLRFDNNKYVSDG